MKTLRPEVRSTNDPAISGGSAYFAIYNAVKAQPGLIHGRLDNEYGAHCAIGSYFALPKHMALPTSLIEEVAAINDSLPNASAATRKREVLRWLRWKLDKLGMRLTGRVSASQPIQKDA